MAWAGDDALQELDGKDNVHLSLGCDALQMGSGPFYSFLFGTRLFKDMASAQDGIV